jgi:hypothetical protein
MLKCERSGMRAEACMERAEMINERRGKRGKRCRVILGKEGVVRGNRRVSVERAHSLGINETPKESRKRRGKRMSYRMIGRLNLLEKGMAKVKLRRERKTTSNK